MFTRGTRFWHTAMAQVIPRWFQFLLCSPEVQRGGAWSAGPWPLGRLAPGVDIGISHDLSMKKLGRLLGYEWDIMGNIWNISICVYMSHTYIYDQLYPMFMWHPPSSMVPNMCYPQESDDGFHSRGMGWYLGIPPTCGDITMVENRTPK